MPESQVVAVFGEKGGGKSTLARLLAEELNPSSVSLKISPGLVSPDCETLATVTLESPAVVYGFTRPIKSHILATRGLVKRDRGWRKAIHEAAWNFPPGDTLTETASGAPVVFADLPGVERRGWAEYLWLKRWERHVAACFLRARWIIADDARTEYEFAEAKRRGWFTVLVTGRRRHSFLHPDFWLRTERSVRRLARRHRREERWLESHPGVARAPQPMFDYVVENTGGLNQLRAQTRRLADWLKELPTLEDRLETAARAHKETEALTPTLSHGERENDEEEA